MSRYGKGSGCLGNGIKLVASVKSLLWPGASQWRIY